MGMVGQAQQRRAWRCTAHRRREGKADGEQGRGHDERFGEHELRRPEPGRVERGPGAAERGNHLAERFPQVTLNQDKHLTDADNLYCAGGTTSACDLYIYLIERFCGANVAQAVARDILYEVQRNYTPGRMGFGGQKLHQDLIILQIQHWLEEHFADKFRFEDVARNHGMSIRNFMRRFQTATGDKPLHYLQRLRIETAKGLLSATRKSIKTISYEVGYDDASFFARLFRQHTELSPNQYRRQFQHKGE